MSFIEKLRNLGVKKQDDQELVSINKGSAPSQETVINEMDEIVQLDIDIRQTPYEFIVYALVPGVSSKDLDIFLEDQGDVLTIKGTRKRPKNEFFEQEEEKETKQKWLIEECHWGPFYRRIILSQEINAAEIEAKLKNGVLILRLPLLKTRIGKRKINILEEK